MRFERTIVWALTMVFIVSAHSLAWAGEIFGGRVATEVTLPGECAGTLQPTESLPLRSALIRLSASPDGQWKAVSCEDLTGTQAVHLRRQGEAWRKITLPEKSPMLRGGSVVRGELYPVVATLAFSDKGLWLTTFQVEPAVSTKVVNGTLYYYPLPSGPVVKVFERPQGGQFGTMYDNIVPSRDDVVVMQGFAGGQRRVIRVTPDGKSEFLSFPSAFSPLYAAPLGPNADYVVFDGSGKAFINSKAVVGLPQREMGFFAANGRAFAFAAGDDRGVWEFVTDGTVRETRFTQLSQVVAASAYGWLAGVGSQWERGKFPTLTLGSVNLVKEGDVILGKRVSSILRQSVTLDDFGTICFVLEGGNSATCLSTPRVSSVFPSAVQQGQDFTITGDSLWFPGGLRTDLVLGAGAPVDPCSARSSGELVCSSKNFPIGDLTFRVRISDGKNFPLGSQPARLTVLPPPAITVTGFTLSRPAIMRGETVDVCFQTSESPSDGWFLSFRGKSGSGWGLGIGTLGQTNRSASRSASMDDVRVAEDRTCVTSRPNEDGEFQLLVGARGNRASAGPLPILVEVPRPRLTACEGEPSAVMPMQGTERLTPGGLARFCGEHLDGALVEFLSGFTEAGETLAEVMETVTTTTSEVVARLPQLAGEVWIRVQREGLVSDWTSVYVAVPPPPEPEPAPEPAPEPEPGEVVP